MIDPKIVSATRLKRILGRRKKSSVVFTNGCFDILHAGHLKYLKAAKAKGDILVVGLNSDESVRRLKGAMRPVNNQRDRAEILAGLSAVDFVVIFTDDTPERLIKTLLPDVLVKGGDWPLDKIVGADIVRQRGGKVLTIPTFKNRSTTGLINKITRLGI